MKPKEFHDAIQAHATLHFGNGPRDDRFYVVFAPGDGIQVGWEIEPGTIRENPWDRLEGVLCGHVRAVCMSHYSRIVGYYSNMRNWNPSKKAEARDRAKGNYDVAEAA